MNDESSKYQAVEGTIVSGRANSFPGFILEVQADMGFAVGERVWISRTAPAYQPAEQPRGEPMAVIRHVSYSGLARSGEAMEAIVLDGVPVLPEGTLLYAAQPKPEQANCGTCGEAIRPDVMTGTTCACAKAEKVVGDCVLAGKYGEVLRPFITLMDRELHANAGKGDRPGWLKMTAEEALFEIYYHMAKLTYAVKKKNSAEIVEFAGDVANISMMLLDICGLLGVTPASSCRHACRGDGRASPISCGSWPPPHAHRRTVGGVENTRRPHRPMSGPQGWRGLQW